MKVEVEFFRSRTPERRTIVRTMTGVPRVGESVATFSWGGFGEVTQVVWMINGAPHIMVRMEGDELPTE